jgi:branched-chain amino acid transport system substrate-binding protein
VITARASQIFQREVHRQRRTIATELDYNGGDRDFKAQLTAIKAANPDGVFVPGYYTDAALICVRPKQLGLNVPLFGGDGWESES